MPYDHDHPTNIASAAQLLAEMLPFARREAAELDPAESAAHLGLDCIKWQRLGNCVGIHAYKNVAGLWIADILFSPVPRGVDPILCVPDDMAAAGRPEALVDAVSLLAAVIAADAAPLPDGSPMVSFSFDDMTWRYPKDYVVDVLSVVKPPARNKVEDALAGIPERILGGRRLTPDVFDRLGGQARKEITAVCMGALVTGIECWPQPGLPDGMRLQ